MSKYSDLHYVDIQKVLNEYVGSAAFEAVITLLDTRIQVYREKLETAIEGDILRYQGAIAELKLLKKELRPRVIKFPEKIWDVNM